MIDKEKIEGIITGLNNILEFYDGLGEKELVEQQIAYLESLQVIDIDAMAEKILNMIIEGDYPDSINGIVYDADECVYIADEPCKQAIKQILEGK